MIAVIKEESDFSNLLLNITYDEIIFENVDFFTFQKSLPILETYGYKTIVFDNCENIHLFTLIFLSIMFEKVVFKNTIIDSSNSFITDRNLKTTNNSIKQIEFVNSIMIGKNISVKKIEKLKFINYELDEKYYYGILNNTIITLIGDFYGYGSFTSVTKTDVIINKPDYFSENFLYKILNISSNITIYFEDGKELTSDYIEKVIKSRIRKEKINNMLNEN